MSFEDKKKALFACLDSAEKSIASDSVLHQDQKNVDYSQRRRPGSSNSRQEPIRKFRGKESIFKRPAAPIGKCLPPGRVPDFKKNPHKWTKYSLEDVDTSDRSNTAAAFSFLREMESKKRDQQRMDDNDGPTEFKGRVKFNRSVKLQARLEEVDRPPPDCEEEDKPKVKGCKVVMPEYVVGQKPKKDRKKVAGVGEGSGKKSRGSELKLDHLMEDEEDEEDDNDGID